MAISNKVIKISILMIIILTLVTLYVKENKSTNVPKSATLVLNRMDDESWKNPKYI